MTAMVHGDGTGRTEMITTETMLPFWTSILAAIGCFFGVRAALRRKKERIKLEEKKLEEKNPETNGSGNNA
jgi:hypothetical protein